MEIRKYTENDFDFCSSLFYSTVHAVNTSDYSEEEINAWAPKDNDYKHLREALKNNKAIVAIDNGVIVGFSDIDGRGYLDHMFVHKDHQKKGIASMMLKELEKGFNHITVHASITARPFFEKRGYRVIKEQQVSLRGVKLKNYLMEKTID